MDKYGLNGKTIRYCPLFEFSAFCQGEAKTELLLVGKKKQCKVFFTREPLGARRFSH